MNAKAKVDFRDFFKHLYSFCGEKCVLLFDNHYNENFDECAIFRNEIKRHGIAMPEKWLLYDLNAMGYYNLRNEAKNILV